MPPQDPVHRDPPPGGPSSPPHHSPTQNSPHQENLPPGENHQTPAKPQTSGHNVTHDTPLDPQATSVGNITLAQALKNYKTQKKAHKTTKSQKKSPPQLDLFHNPEVIVDSFTNQTPFTTLANFVFSFKLHKSPDTEIGFPELINLIKNAIKNDTELNTAFDEPEFNYEKINPTSFYVHINDPGVTLNPNLTTKLQALIDLTASNHNTRTSFPTENALQNAVIMKLSVPAFIHNKQLSELANDLYKEYGEVIKTMWQPSETMKSGLFDIKEYKDAFVILNLTAPCVPPLSKRLLFHDNWIETTSKVNSPLKFCSYCKSLSHHHRQCPLKRGCLQCGNDKMHSLVNCTLADSATIAKHLAIIPESYIDFTSKHLPDGRVTPKWIKLYQDLMGKAQEQPTPSSPNSEKPRAKNQATTLTSMYMDVTTDSDDNDYAPSTTEETDSDQYMEDDSGNERDDRNNYQPSEDHELSHLGNPEPTSFTGNEYEGFIPQENDHRHLINSHPLNSAEAALLQNISEMN